MPSIQTHSATGSAQDQNIARAYLASAIGLLQQSGFQMSLNFEMKSWASLMRSAPGTTVVNLTFDPDASDIRPGAAFWISINDQNGIAACIADRLFETENFVDELESGRLWRLTEPQMTHMTPCGTRAGLSYPGHVGHAGGLWIDRRARKQGLSWILPRLTRALSIINWDVDRHCGVSFGDLYQSGMTAHSYGFPEGHKCVEGWFAPTGKHETIFLVHITREQILSQLVGDIEIIRRAGDKHMRDVAVIVGQRQQQPAVRANVG
jgi:hypothetical protein